MSAIDQLVANVLAAANKPDPFAVGVVVASVSNGDRPPTVTVAWNGAEVIAACPRHYTPAVDDVVVMLRVGPQLNIVGAY